MDRFEKRSRNRPHSYLLPSTALADIRGLLRCPSRFASLPLPSIYTSCDTLAPPTVLDHALSQSAYSPSSQEQQTDPFYSDSHSTLPQLERSSALALSIHKLQSIPETNPTSLSTPPPLCQYARLRRPILSPVFTRIFHFSQRIHEPVAEKLFHWRWF